MPVNNKIILRKQLSFIFGILSSLIGQLVRKTTYYKQYIVFEKMFILILKLTKFTLNANVNVDILMWYKSVVISLQYNILKHFENQSKRWIIQYNHVWIKKQPFKSKYLTSFVRQKLKSLSRDLIQFCNYFNGSKRLMS